MMMIYAIYDKTSGVIYRSVDMPEFMINMLTLSDSESMVEIPRMANDVTEYIKDGVLTPKPIADNTAN